MPLAHANLVVDVGAEFTEPIVWRDADGESLLTDGPWSARLVGRDPISGETVLEFDSTSDVAMTLDIDEDAGTVAIRIPADQPADLAGWRRDWVYYQVTAWRDAHPLSAARLTEGIISLKGFAEPALPDPVPEP